MKILDAFWVTFIPKGCAGHLNIEGYTALKLVFQKKKKKLVFQQDVLRIGAALALRGRVHLRLMAKIEGQGRNLKSPQDYSRVLQHYLPV